MTLLLSTYTPELVPGCCPGDLYAIVFGEDDSELALKDNGSSVLTLQSFDKDNQVDFAIALNEKTNRTRYYSVLLADGGYTLPDNTAGSYYTVEYWQRALTGSTSRQDDTLREVDTFVIHDGTRVDSKLGTGDLDLLANWQAHAAVSYDSTNQVVGVVGWLEKNGELYITDESKRYFNFKWIAPDGTVIDETTQTTYLADLEGVFYYTISEIDLDPDAVLPAVATIRDSNGTDHKTTTTVVTWD